MSHRDDDIGAVQMSYELKEYLKTINKTKENLMEGEDEMWEKKYPAFIINKCLAPTGMQECLIVNEINRLHHLDNKLQYDFLLNSLRSMNRYAPWMKAKKSKNLEYVKEYFGYSNEKAKAALDVLDDEQIAMIKSKLNKGGRK